MEKSIIQSDVYPAKCQRCHQEWEVYHFEDPFHIENLPMKCTDCQEVKWVNIFEDPFYFSVFKSFSKATKIAIGPWFGKFYREFEKTCAPCSCGGTYRIQNGVCPFCSSALIDVDLNHRLRTERVKPDYIAH